nr:hypothetical protein [Nocardia jinanensis]
MGRYSGAETVRAVEGEGRAVASEYGHTPRGVAEEYYPAVTPPVDDDLTDRIEVGVGRIGGELLECLGDTAAEVTERRGERGRGAACRFGRRVGAAVGEERRGSARAQVHDRGCAPGSEERSADAFGNMRGNGIERESAHHVIQFHQIVGFGAENEFADPGVHAVGADEQVGPQVRAVTQRDLDRIGLLGHRLHCGGEPDIGVSGHHVVQRGLQIATEEAQRPVSHRRLRDGGGHGELLPAVGVHENRREESDIPWNERGQQAEPLGGVVSGPVQVQQVAAAAPRGGPLEHDDIPAFPVHPQRRRQPGYTRAHDHRPFRLWPAGVSRRVLVIDHYCSWVSAAVRISSTNS